MRVQMLKTCFTYLSFEYEAKNVQSRHKIVCITKVIEL